MTYRTAVGRSAYNASYHARHREKLNARSRAWHAAHPGYERGLMYRRHGLTEATYDAMNARQDGRCAICRQPESIFRGGERQRLAIDHDHAHCPGTYGCAECVRGLLCHECNRGIYHERPEVLRAAADYFERAA